MCDIPISILEGRKRFHLKDASHRALLDLKNVAADLMLYKESVKSHCEKMSKVSS